MVLWRRCRLFRMNDCLPFNCVEKSCFDLCEAAGEEGYCCVSRYHTAFILGSTVAYEILLNIQYNRVSISVVCCQRNMTSLVHSTRPIGQRELSSSVHKVQRCHLERCRTFARRKRASTDVALKCQIQFQGCFFSELLYSLDYMLLFVIVLFCRALARPSLSPTETIHFVRHRNPKPGSQAQMV